MSKSVYTLTGIKKRPLSNLNFGKILGVTSVLVSSNMFVQANENSLIFDSQLDFSKSAANSSIPLTPILPAIPDLVQKVPIPKEYRNHQNGVFDFASQTDNFGLENELTDEAAYTKTGDGTL